MSAAKINLPVLEVGATYRHSLAWKDNDNLPMDLTGCTARMQLRATVDSSAVICDLSTANGRIVIPEGGTTGEINLAISSTITTLLKPVTVVYDLEVYFLNGDTVRLIEGNILIKGEVTRG